MRSETMEHIVLLFYVVAIMIPLGQLLRVQQMVDTVEFCSYHQHCWALDYRVRQLAER
jgi:hypothetical protein